MNDKGYWQVIKNRNNHDCELTSRLNDLYGNGVDMQSRFEQHMAMPEEIGRGYWRRIRPNEAFELIVCDIAYRQNMTMSSREGGHTISLGFCIGESLRWSVEGRKGEFGLDQGEVTVYDNHGLSSSCNYEAGRRFQGVTLKLNQASLQGLLRHLPLDTLRAALSGSKSMYINSRSTPAMKRIIHELVHCPYEGDIKRIYLEGKVLELFAAYLHESLLEKREAAALQGLSRSDMASLHEAKLIVDANLANPPGLAALSRMVCLNEFKLKRGFKQMFGMPVHAYVINQRLETAVRLLERGERRITEAAFAAGFGKAGQFSEHFKRKYGVSPSQFFQL